MLAGSWSASPLRLALILGCILGMLLVGNVQSATAALLEKGGVQPPLPARNLFLHEHKAPPTNIELPAPTKTKILITPESLPPPPAELSSPIVKRSANESTTSLVTLVQGPGQPPITPPMEGEAHALVGIGSVWKYLDNGSDQGSAWHDIVFDDSAWASGGAQLGYGDGDEHTVVSFGPDPNNKYITTYFRRTFNVPDASRYKDLMLRLLSDDGAVVYLNGQEVFRNNMPVGPISSQSVASTTITGGAENIYRNKRIEPRFLVNGTNIVAVEVHQDRPDSSDISFDMELIGTTVQPLISRGATWKYLDNGSDQGAAWRAPSFNDGTWAAGPAQLGYGDNDESTVVSYGPDANNKYITTYFRHSFDVADAAVFKGLKLRLLKDDGAVVYLNGQEVFRSSMPAGAVTATTLANDTTDENAFAEKSVDPQLLVNGTNVVAVEVHQASVSSSDISFDLELLPTNPAAIIPSGAVWKYLDNGTDQGTAWRSPTFADGAWAAGSAQLGYGDGDEATTVSFGSDPNNKPVTTYFRRTFNIGDPSAYHQLTVRLLRDDGAIVYVNGAEAFRSNMPAGAVNYRTFAATGVADADENKFFSGTIDPALLVRGTNVIAVEVHQDRINSSDISFDLELVGSKANVVDSDGVWKYLDNGADQGTAWRSTSFNDSAWLSGSAQLGYGDGDEATVVGYGPDPNNKYTTTYFRRTFNVANASLYKSYVLRLLRDDGAVVYLNGTEVFRSNMPNGTITATTSSLEDVINGEESIYNEKVIDPSLLVTGTNVLAVEVHQAYPSSSDISFNLELLAVNKPPNVTVTAPAGGTSVAGPTSFTVSAEASDDDGTISKVEFYSNSKLIGSTTTSPYSIDWGNVAPGTYAVRAVATDDSGATSISAPVTVTVTSSSDPPPPLPPACKTADVVALDQAFFYNRLGAVNPAGMVYALRRDVVPTDSSLGLVPGKVQLRRDKRPRPLVLRMNVGDCLTINFQNLLAPMPKDEDQPATRTAGVHVIGMQLVNSIRDDGSNVGQNPNSLVGPGGTATYTIYAEREGNNLLYSTAATTGGEGDGGSLAMGLFGSVNVEPRNAEWYRSQVTAEEMQLATTGTTPDGHPIINYDAFYPAGHRFAGLPILKILQGNNIVHSDLNAIITGPNKGRFPAGTFPPNRTEPDRDQPFREFTVVYHDEIQAIQAFPQFEDPVLSHTLHSVRDGFALNYGTGGIGAEILANRFGVGPMHNCTECKFEEFFLSAWTVSDPAQIVDVPANTTDSGGNLIVGPKATKALFPDDPSNVHHSYINDHVKFRIVHAGPKEHHIHHLHAHQWLQTPDDSNSTYLDSQALGPGYAFTAEITYNGSGNRNKVVGDSIFHCHFYPHFAQGMWELWRSHDVFERGTVLDGDGRPVAGTRALPDGEIARGTPIPAIVPLPTLAMAPLPEAQVQIVNGQIQITGSGNPGYPFFVAALAGHRPPHPPLDTIDDGGLPRHIITGGTTHHVETRLDFSKELLTADAEARPENGTPVEIAAMNFHAQRVHPSFTPEGAAKGFITNGLPPKPGAPYADPCVNDNGEAVGSPRLYKAAVIQLDVKFNKAGWHFPQTRMLSLWEDVQPTKLGTRPPEPLFFRANTNDCITFQHTVLAPNVYQLDDFQVRTPTDVMGQHIHLVKFDVTSSDGSGNGWNYEDGTFSPDEVIERINAINRNGGLKTFGGPAKTQLTPKPHPFFGTLGAQTTVQRWFADDTLNNNGVDRTLRTVFTHDHFGPSTHQQIGLYAGLVTEPLGSTWKHNETGQPFYTRPDGGPTSWQAVIQKNTGTGPNDSYREFLLEFADFTLAYQAGGGVDANGNPVPDPARAINPPAKNEVGLPFLVEKAAVCPGGAPLPCPEAISAADPGTMTLNYRNEPIALRVRNPNSNTQAAGVQGDLSHAYRSDVLRADPNFNVQPNFYPTLTADVHPGDPFTPLIRAYEDDNVQVRILIGGQEEGHNFGIHGIKWKHQPGTPDDPAAVNNSGYRNNQMMGISEHFEFLVPKLPRRLDPTNTFADYLYEPGAAVDDQWNGLWGIVRGYKFQRPDLIKLLNNLTLGTDFLNSSDLNGVCPRTAPVKAFDITAVSASNALPGGTLVYNPRPNQGGKLHDPTAIMFVRTSDLNPSTGQLSPSAPREPLVLRANAGDCLSVTLNNRLPVLPPDLDGFNTLPMIVEHFNANQLKPSPEVGLHPQLVAFDVTRGDGFNVGLNPVQTISPGGRITYQWYAGDLSPNNNGVAITTPIEFGATNLSSSDPIKHSNKGAFGSLIIEPTGATWIEDSATRAQATVTKSDATSFREFVLMFQNDVNLRRGDGNGTAVPVLAEEEDSEDTGQKAFNYRTEPLWKRMGFEPDTPLTTTRGFDFTNVLSNSQVGGDPVTPIFTARAGQAVRFRVLMAGGHARNNVFNLHGHIWEDEPYEANSTVIGTNPLSEWKGAQYGVGAGSHFDILLKRAAGSLFKVPGDYLYRSQQSFQFDGGLWGIFRVTPP
jgi:hypothetical protein